MWLEIIPGIVALVCAGCLWRAQRKLKAYRYRAEHAESEMGKIMKYRGITRSDLDAIESPERLGRTH